MDLKERAVLLKAFNMQEGHWKQEGVPKCKNCKNACNKCRFNYFLSTLKSAQESERVMV